MKIAVLYGGTSGERDVSISTGKGVINALKANKHEVIAIDFDPQNLKNIVDLDVDLVFIALHGKYGEDGKVQSLLEMLSIPYVGSGVLASALAMDKYKAKQIFSLHRSEEHTSELQSRGHLVCRLLLEKKKDNCHVARVSC